VLFDKATDAASRRSNYTYFSFNILARRRLTNTAAKVKISLGEHMANIAALARPLSSLPVQTERVDRLDFTQALSAVPRGSIAEILGNESTGRTALAQSMLATATLGGEIAAWIDCEDAFDPASAAKAGGDLGKMLWVQCGHRLETALKAADMVLHNGGFGLIVLDLCNVAPGALNRVPISYWYRMRRAVEHTPSVLLILGQQSITRSCAARQFGLDRPRLEWRGENPFQTIVRLTSEASSKKPVPIGPAALEAIANTEEEG
jgi:hypothetical protein